MDYIERILVIITGTTGLIGLMVRFALVPYLRDQLIAPVQETHRQVTENGHANDSPTVMDLIHDVQAAIDKHSSDVRALSGVLDEHLRYSDRWVSLMERELEQLRRDKETP